MRGSWVILSPDLLFLVRPGPGGFDPRRVRFPAGSIPRPGLRCKLTDIFWPHAWILGYFEPGFTFSGAARSWRVRSPAGSIPRGFDSQARAPLQANRHFWPHAWILGYFEPGFTFLVARSCGIRRWLRIAERDRLLLAQNGPAPIAMADTHLLAPWCRILGI